MGNTAPVIEFDGSKDGTRLSFRLGSSYGPILTIDLKYDKRMAEDRGIVSIDDGRDVKKFGFVLDSYNGLNPEPISLNENGQPETIVDVQSMRKFVEDTTKYLNALEQARSESQKTKTVKEPSDEAINQGLSWPLRRSSDGKNQKQVDVEKVNRFLEEIKYELKVLGFHYNETEDFGEKSKANLFKD